MSPIDATISRSAPGCPRSPASCFASDISAILTSWCCSAPLPARRWRCAIRASRSSSEVASRRRKLNSATAHRRRSSRSLPNRLSASFADKLRRSSGQAGGTARPFRVLGCELRKCLGPRGRSVQHQIVFLDRESVGANVRKPEFPHSYKEYEATWTPEEILERLKDATIAIINKVPMRADKMKQLPKLKLIGVAATGTYEVN